MLNPHSDILSTLEKPFHHHANARTIRRSLRRLDFDWNEIFSFTTIRNPWKRAVSFWRYGERNPASVWHKRRNEAEGFDAFCELIPAGTAAIRFAGDGERLLVSRIIRLEDLGREYPKIAKQLGITIPAGKASKERGEKNEALHTNSTEPVDHRQFFSPRSRARVAALFASDIELGGYRFDDR